MFTDQEIQIHTRLTKIEFLEFVEKFTGANLRQRELNLHAQCLLFRMRLCQDNSFEQLGSFFTISERAARKIFLRMVIHYYLHLNNIPTIVNQDGTVNAQERVKLYEFADNNTPDYFKRLVQDLEDPTGRNRKAVLLSIDATYYYTQASGDFVQMKELFCSFKSHHIIKLMNITDLKGKFMALIPLATSSSPASGDHHLIQRFSQIEDNYPNQVNYVRTLLEGTDEFFCCLIADAGFVTDLRNKPREVQDAPTLVQLCDDAGAVLLHTSETNEGYVFRQNAANKIVKDYSDGPEITAVENRIKMTRIFRTVQEQIHATLKQRFRFLNKKHISNSYLRPLSPAQMTRFNLPQAYRDTSLLTFITTICCSDVNQYHPGYSILYLSQEDQIPAAERVLTRLFTINPLLHQIWPQEMCFDAATGGNWINSTFRSFYDLNLFPRLESHQVNPVALDLVSGPHALLKGLSLLTYMGQLTIQKQNLNLTRLETQQYLEQPPNDWKVQYCQIRTPNDFVPTAACPRWSPPWYDQDQFGPWNDMTFVRCRIPPSHKSATSVSNFHFAVIGFGTQTSDHLRLLQPYDKVYAWKCFRCPAKNGSLSMCRHMAAMLIPISFPQEYRSTFKPVDLFSATGPESRQSMRILPPVTESQPIPLNIPRRSGNTRRNLTFYDFTQNPRQSTLTAASTTSSTTTSTVPVASVSSPSATTLPVTSSQISVPPGSAPSVSVPPASVPLASVPPGPVSSPPPSLPSVSVTPVIAPPISLPPVSSSPPSQPSVSAPPPIPPSPVSPPSCTPPPTSTTSTNVFTSIQGILSLLFVVNHFIIRKIRFN